MRLTNLDLIQNQRHRCVKRHVLVLDQHVMTSRELNVKTVVVVAEVVVTVVTAPNVVKEIQFVRRGEAKFGAELSKILVDALRLGVISNFDSRIYGVLRSLDIGQFFSSVTISSETGFAKPQPEIFAAAVEAIGIPANRILLVGDNLMDDVQAGTMAVMAIADTAPFALARQRGRHY